MDTLYSEWGVTWSVMVSLGGAAHIAPVVFKTAVAGSEGWVKKLVSAGWQETQGIWKSTSVAFLRKERKGCGESYN